MRLCSLPTRRIPIRIPAVDPESLAFSLPRHRAGLRAALYCLALFAIAACGSGDGSNSAPFHVVEGVRALEVVGAAANTEAWVEDAGGNRVTSGTTDASGNWAATVAPGRGYRVVVSGLLLAQQSASVDVFALAGFDVRESVEQLHVTGATVEDLCLRGVDQSTLLAGTNVMINMLVQGANTTADECPYGWRFQADSGNQCLSQPINGKVENGGVTWGPGYTA